MFQANAFTASEMRYLNTSIRFKNYFQTIINETENCKDVETQLVPGLLTLLESFIEYKKKILTGLLMCKIRMNFPPTLINHQINEAMEFRHLLMMTEEAVISNPVELASRIKIWLADSSGHAAGLMSFIDPAETRLTVEAQMFKEKSDKLFIKASE